MRSLPDSLRGDCWLMRYCSLVRDSRDCGLEAFSQKPMIVVLHWSLKEKELALGLQLELAERQKE